MVYLKDWIKKTVQSEIDFSSGIKKFHLNI